jgi:ubiquinone/menaquinone biosynthesis C-methylase UbiE
MGRWLARRSTVREIFDDVEPAQDVTDRMFRFLSGVNRRLGGTSATLARFRVFARSWPPGARVDVLDVASGAADVPAALVAWGRRHGFDLRVTAVDRSRGAMDFARRYAAHDPRVRLVRADLHDLCFKAQSFDYVTTALFAHHLTDAEFADFLRIAERLARKGVVINDLVRSRQAYVATWLLTWPFDSMLHADGPLSVARAFTPDEFTAFATQAGMPWLTVERHFGERMTLAGERASGAVRAAAPNCSTG